MKKLIIKTVTGNPKIKVKAVFLGFLLTVSKNKFFKIKEKFKIEINMVFRKFFIDVGASIKPWSIP